MNIEPSTSAYFTQFKLSRSRSLSNFILKSCINPRVNYHSMLSNSDTCFWKHAVFFSLLLIFKNLFLASTSFVIPVMSFAGRFAFAAVRGLTSSTAELSSSAAVHCWLDVLAPVPITDLWNCSLLLCDFRSFSFGQALFTAPQWKPCLRNFDFCDVWYDVIA